MGLLGFKFPRAALRQSAVECDGPSVGRKLRMVVWWATPVEMLSAFARLQRTKDLSPKQHSAARRQLEQLRPTWREMQPTVQLRAQSESPLEQFPLKAADALQLAAAMAWCAGRTLGRVLLSKDRQLLEAATQLGFRTIEA